MEQVASLEEIETHYSIDDLASLNDVLDYKIDAQAEIERRKKGGKR